jgi:hypothetical protein
MLENSARRDHCIARIAAGFAAMTIVRAAAVAGLFYPDDPRELRAMLGRFLAAAAPAAGPAPKALIVPHAGYVYSGPVAASAYARLRAARGQVARVVLLGPAHYVGFHGLALAGADWFETPLGRIAIDKAAEAALADLPQVQTLPAAHAREHSLEVHLPFLQELLGEFRLVPLVAGEASAAEVDAVLERLWGGPETLIVVSSDLSHYHDYASAQRLDRATTRAIEALRYEDLGHEDACGRVPVSGLLSAVRRRGLAVRTVDLRNSGDTAGPRDRVVGYGAYVVA